MVAALLTMVMAGLAVSFATAGARAQAGDRSRSDAWSRSEVEANGSSREILLGTIRTGQGAPQERTSVADQILADGLDALRRGDVMLGRRRLEAVAEAYPDSSAAMIARDELRDLYRIRRPPPTSLGGDESQPRWIPTQESTDSEASTRRGTNHDASSRYDRSLDKEARARELQQRIDQRRLLALSYDFQMAAGDRIFFAETSVDIGARARSVLTAQARWLARHTDLPVVIEAHSDDYPGNRDLEIQIAERRARAVQERLVEDGVAVSRITIVAYGRDRPVATCRAPECAAQNRRAITRVGGLPSVAGSRRGIEEPALAIVPRDEPAPRGRD
ncbi:MAG: OmpA family protein [Hyphomicrobiaceae bacterium]